MPVPHSRSDDDPLTSLRPGTALRRALDGALAEMDAGLPEPSPEWKVRYALMLGLERVLSEKPPRLASGTELRRHCRGGDLQTCQGAAVDRAQQADHRVAQAELGLPDREGDPDEIGIAVMQHMCAAGNTQCAPFTALCRSLVGSPGGLDCCIDRHACSNRDDNSPQALLRERVLPARR